MNISQAKLARPISKDTRPLAPLANPTDRAAAPPSRTWRGTVTALIQIALVAVLGVVGWWGYTVILDTAPKAERTERPRVARLVETTTIGPAQTGPVIEAWGAVRPAQTLIVRPEVSGMVVWVHPNVTRGGRVRAGDSIAKLDDRDLALALAQAEAQVAEIEARILIERGQGELGKRELQRLSRNITQAQRDLVLRKPQMAQLTAELAAAKAEVDQARIALEKADIQAPFDAIVIDEAIAPGSMITQGSETATLVAADRFYVILALPAAALEWLRFDGTQTVSLTQPGIWPEGLARTGTVIRLGAGLTETGRMVEVIVDVTDPLGASAPGVPPLLLESFVKARLEAPKRVGTVALNRAYLRDNDTVWVMNDQDKLEIRQVDILWRGPETVLITDGLTAGERIVTTYLSTHAPGMDLRTAQESAPEGSGT